MSYEEEDTWTRSLIILLCAPLLFTCVCVCVCVCVCTYTHNVCTLHTYNLHTNTYTPTYTYVYTYIYKTNRLGLPASKASLLRGRPGSFGYTLGLFGLYIRSHTYVKRTAWACRHQRRHCCVKWVVYEYANHRNMFIYLLWGSLQLIMRDSVVFFF